MKEKTKGQERKTLPYEGHQGIGNSAVKTLAGVILSLSAMTYSAKELNVPTPERPQIAYSRIKEVNGEKMIEMGLYNAKDYQDYLALLKSQEEQERREQPKRDLLWFLFGSGALLFGGSLIFAPGLQNPYPPRRLSINTREQGRANQRLEEHFSSGNPIY